MRFLLPTPIAVNPGQTVVGNLKLIANKEQSFDVKITMKIPELNIESSNEYDMKDPEYRWASFNYYGAQSQWQNQNAYSGQQQY
jgi:hypothetical protein